jgi:hypothetical protein
MDIHFTLGIPLAPYIGALLAHWLDGIVGCYAAAFLLSRLLLPAAAADWSRQSRESAAESLRTSRPVPTTVRNRFRQS